MSFNRPGAGHPPVVIVVWIMMLSQDAAPVSCLGCPRYPDFSSLFSLCPGMSLSALCLVSSTLLILGFNIDPGHKNLLTVSLGVINTPEYNVELINRCYLLFTTSSAGFQ